MKGVTALAMGTDLDNHGELLLHNGGEEEYVCNTGEPRRCLLVLLCPVIKVNGKLQQLNPGWTTNGPEPSRMKVWVSPLGKNHEQLTCFLKVKEIWSGYWKNVVTNTSYNHMTSYRNEDCNYHEYFSLFGSEYM